jgi:hypothetical protein
MSKFPGLTLSALLLAACLSASAAAPERETQSFSGEVLEVQNVDSYTYVRLKSAGGEIWAAVPKTPVKVGSRITVGNAMTMHDFDSKTLKKHFDRIVFGQLVDAAGKAQAAAPMSAAPAAPAAPPVRVAKAPGQEGRTVAEVVANRVALKGKPVLVHGQVVKVNLGIMGKNWLHVRDGSGSGSEGTNDVLVTSKDVASVGDIVTARGTVRTDVDLGSGYNYPVLIEDAVVRK